MKLRELVGILDSYLDAAAVQDYCPNGLQVEGRSEVHKIVTGVSACRELFERAAEVGADMVLVHHGVLWNASEVPRITGVLARRLRILFENDMSLVAYHLPLDRHLDVGNAAVMARELGLVELEKFGIHAGLSVGVRGRFPGGRKLAEVIETVGKICRREADVFGPVDCEVHSMGIVTGSAVKEYHQAVELGLDAYLTGEVSEWVFHQAREERIPFIAAGHHATERFGVRALGEWISSEYGIDVEFVDLPNPV